jgi:hypothetical protein
VIFLLDQIEDARDLTRPEFNFRNIVKSHLKHQLQVQSDYWKSRCTVRLFKLGGENTKFFIPRPQRDIDKTRLLKSKMMMEMSW